MGEFEQVFNIIKSVPLRLTKGLFAFYTKEFVKGKTLLERLSEREKILYGIQ